MSRVRLPRSRPLATVLLGLTLGAADAGGITVRKVEAIEGPDTTVKILLSAPLATPPRARLLAKRGQDPDRVVIDLLGADLQGKRSRAATVGWGGIQRLRLGTPSPEAARLVIDLDRPLAFAVATDGNVVTVTLREPTAVRPAVPDEASPGVRIVPQAAATQ
jgi:hypothetical protein